MCSVKIVTLGDDLNNEYIKNKKVLYVFKTIPGSEFNINYANLLNAINAEMLKLHKNIRIALNNMPKILIRNADHA